MVPSMSTPIFIFPLLVAAITSFSLPRNQKTYEIKKEPHYAVAPLVLNLLSRRWVPCA
jgi:hypothetical protein